MHVAIVGFSIGGFRLVRHWSQPDTGLTVYWERFVKALRPTG